MKKLKKKTELFFFLPLLATFSQKDFFPFERNVNGKNTLYRVFTIDDQDRENSISNCPKSALETNNENEK